MEGLKQEDMARLLGMHRTTYAALEKDPGRFTVDQAHRFCRITERGFEEVFGPDKRRRQ